MVIRHQVGQQQHAQLSQEAREVTEMLRKQIFTNEMAQASGYAVGEVFDVSEESAMMNAKGGGTRHCLAGYQTVSWVFTVSMWWIQMVRTCAPLIHRVMSYAPE